MAGGSVRALTVALNVRDHATKLVGDLKNDLKRIEGRATVAQLKANDAASKPIKNVAKSLNEADKAAMQAFKSLGHFETGVSRTTRAVAKMEGAFGRVNRSIQTYSNNLEKAQEKTKHLETLQGPMAGAAAMSGAFIGLSVMTSSEIDKNMASAMNSAKNQQEAALYEAFVKSGSGGNQAIRAIAARKGSVGLQGIDEISAQENIEFLDLVINEAQKTGANINEIESAVEGLYTGSADTINDILGGFGISNDTLNAMIEQARKEQPDIWGADPKAAGARTDEEMMTIFAVREYTKLLKERRAESEKTGGMELDSATKLTNAMIDLRATLSHKFDPMIEFMAKGAEVAARFTTKFPKATLIIAVGLALTFVVATLVLFLSMALPGILALHSMAAGMTLASVAAGVFSGAMAVLNAILALNPVVLIAVALVALGAVLVYVAKKTGVLSKAWEYLSGLWDDLKEMDMGEVGKKAASVLFKMVFPPAVLAVFLKNIPGIQSIIERVERTTTKLLDKAAEFKDQAVDALKNLIPGWLKNIWNRLKEVFTGFVQAIIKTFGGLMPEGYKEQLEAYTQLQEAAAAGEGGDAARARRYGILGYDAKDDEYKIARFVAAQGVSPEAAAGVLGEKGYATWAEYQGMTATQQAMLAATYGGSFKASELGSEYDIEGWKRFNSYLAKSGHDHPTPEDVVEVAAAVGKPGISTAIVEGGKDILTAPPGTGTEYDQQVRANSEAVREGLVEGIKSLNETPPGTGTEYDQQVRANSEAVREGLVEGIKSLNETPPGTGTEYDQQVRANSDEARSKIGAILGRSKIGAILGIGDGVGLLAEGGGVETTGLLIGHEGEEVSPADVVHKTTAAERLVEMLMGDSSNLAEAMGYGHGRSEAGKGNTINVYVTVQQPNDKWNKFDLIRLIENQVKRYAGQWKT